MYKLIKNIGTARRGEFTTVHGKVQTPAFMNVATAGAIKGALSAQDLEDIRCQVMLSNTYHLHLRPTDKVVKQMGGLHKFTTWKKPILTDSGGFQVFSLASLRKIKEEGVTFASHIDGHRIFMGPEESMQIQSNLGSTIAMAFDECIENPAEYNYTKQSVERKFQGTIQHCFFGLQSGVCPFVLQVYIGQIAGKGFGNAGFLAGKSQKLQGVRGAVNRLRADGALLQVGGTAFGGHVLAGTYNMAAVAFKNGMSKILGHIKLICIYAALRPHAQVLTVNHVCSLALSGQRNVPEPEIAPGAENDPIGNSFCQAFI